MIKEEEYKQRREHLLQALEENTIGVVFCAEYKTRSNDTEYPFRQDSNFYYLSGLKEDNAILVFIKSKKKVKSILFVQKKDKLQELWNGKRIGRERAKKLFAFDEVYTTQEFLSQMKSYIEPHHTISFDFDAQQKNALQLKGIVKNNPLNNDIKLLINTMRLIKSKSEIELIQKAIDITAQAHHRAMQLYKIGLYEYQLQAEFEYIFKKNGAYSDAYTSIVAGGERANTLHYIANDKTLRDGELILIDSGCEYEYYASDITRSIPVNGVFSSAQRKLYNMVLDVQEQIIKMIQPGIKRTKLQKKSEELLCKGLLELGILQGDLKELLKKKVHKKYYPHGIGHWMGLDVHDEAPYKDQKGEEILLAEGMVLTIEPGIYIDKNDKNVPKKFRGIGIRIEDDILVTSKGCKNMSKHIAKTPKEIEKLYLS